MKRKTFAAAAAAALAAAALTAWTLWGNTALTAEKITVSSERLPAAFSGFAIAQVSDLRNAEFGEDNEKLLDLLAGLSPDMIALTGDLVDSRSTDLGIALRFAEKAAEIAPVCYVPGNHEARIADYDALREGLSAAGVTVLEDAALPLSRAGESITLIGLRDPDFAAGSPGSPARRLEETLTALTQDASGFTLLLSHRPEYFSVYAGCGIDLTLSGHAHGGQIRLPFLGGLLAPGQGFFPEYDAGLCREGDAQMVVRRGLGNSVFPLRVNNRPEVVLITLQAAGAETFAEK